MSKVEDNTIMETADEEAKLTCSDTGKLKRAFQLALLCTKKHPSERPTMHEVARVLLSLLPVTETEKPWAAAPAHKAAEIDYGRLLAARSDIERVDVEGRSSSDAQWFVKFGEVISKNSL